MRSRCGHRDRSPNVSFRRRQALTLHRPEQNRAVDLRSTPATHRAPHSGHSASPTPPRTATKRLRNRRSVRHCLARHAEEQNKASGLAPDLSRSPQARQFLSLARRLPSDTKPA
ncbi:hypothetical protein ACVWXU_000856 [Streptomyces sp. TE33382]